MGTHHDSVTPADLAAGVADFPLLAEGAAVDRSMMVVDLDADLDADTAARAVDRARNPVRLLIGLRTRREPLTPEQLAVAAALDTTVTPTESASTRSLVGVADPEHALGELAAAIVDQEHAAMVLAHVLRASETLSVPEALDVESLGYSTLLGTPGFRRWLEARGPRPLPPPSPMEPVLIERDGDCLRVTLNRPERRNAYGAEVRDGLVEALRLVHADGTVASVVLDGAGPVFSAGGDLDEFGTTPDLGTAHLIRTRAGAARLVDALADRIEVRVHGACVGAGIEVPAFASRIVAAPGTVFRLPEVSMGLIPGAGGCVGVPRRIGRWRAYWMCVTNVGLDTETALAWGLIDEIA